MDEQAVEIQEALAEYYANPEAYSIDDFEEIFQDRYPFEFLYCRTPMLEYLYEEKRQEVRQSE